MSVKRKVAILSDMARTREFDLEEALDAALKLFWEKGYEATSVQDLVDATGVNRASLYETFGCKRALFEKALGRFVEDHDPNVAAAGAEPGLPRIRAILEQAGRDAASDPRGCMMVNTMVELAAQDAGIRALGQSARTQMQNWFASCLDDAARLGQIPPEGDRAAQSLFLANTVFGLRVMAKTAPDETAVRSVVDMAIAALR